MGEEGGKGVGEEGGKGAGEEEGKEVGSRVCMECSYVEALQTTLQSVRSQQHYHKLQIHT